MLDMGYVQNKTATWRSFPSISSILHNLKRSAARAYLAVERKLAQLRKGPAYRSRLDAE